MADSDFAQTVAKQEALTQEAQQKAGQPVAGDIDEEHKNFLKTLFSLLDSGEIDPFNQHTFLKMDVYEKLDEEWKDKTDLALINLTNQVRLIDQYRLLSETEESLQLQTMIEQVWQTKQRIEEEHDVFKF